ncbi:unnamed protein product [Musa hybrid cultivar]
MAMMSRFQSNALAREHQESPWDSVVTIDSLLRALRFGDTKIRCIRLVSIDDKKANVHHREEAMHGPSQPQSYSPNLPNIAPILLCLLWSFETWMAVEIDASPIA